MMMNKISLNFSKNIVLHKFEFCCFKTSAICSANTVKQSSIMNKLMSKGNSKRKWHYAPEGSFVNPATSLAKVKGQPAHSSRKRVTVLNKLFMKYITDLMTTGDISTKVYGKQIEISKVSMAPDFQLVNVFWISKGTPDENETEKVLAEIAGQLRHELSQLKIIGLVPKIKFVKDKNYAKIMEVEIQLAKADFGEDFVPTDQSFLLKSEFTLNSQLEPHIVKRIQILDAGEEMEDVVLPPMRHDVFGLDRHKLINRISSSMNMSKNAWNKTETVSTVSEINVQKFIPQELAEIKYISSKEQKQQFHAFLKKREIMKKKAAETKVGFEVDQYFVHEDENNDSYDFYDDIFDEYEKEEEEIDNLYN